MNKLVCNLITNNFFCLFSATVNAVSHLHAHLSLQILYSEIEQVVS